MTNGIRRALATSSSALLLASCGGAAATPAATPSGPSGSITVFAAASLTGAFTRIGSDFQRAHPTSSVHFSFAGSSTLVTQLQQGANADVFASADQPNMEKLVAGGLIHGAPAIFARNRLAIVVGAGNPKHIMGLASLSQPGLIVLLCAAVVPCGRYGNQALQQAGVTVKPASLEADVKSVVGKVALGEADAGLVYVTDVKAGGPKVQGVAIPEAQNVIAAYPVAPLKDSQNLALARAFIGYVMESGGGQATLRQFGFLGP
ncbi:MAG TPA: molybdate ABC transporter substrate-binding protein [Candidatus Dormibacteraeota bacterium]|nr:molybdate ABC transporter substrate-binding protein [Candidatus Dormibacteraeota bacterium]